MGYPNPLNRKTPDLHTVSCSDVLYILREALRSIFECAKEGASGHIKGNAFTVYIVELSLKYGSCPDVIAVFVGNKYSLNHRLRQGFVESRQYLFGARPAIYQHTAALIANVCGVSART